MINVLKFCRPPALLSRGDLRLVHAVQEQTDRLKTSSDQQLAAKFQSLPERDVASKHANRSNQSVLAQAFALTAESLRRTAGMTPYDVQLLAGLAMARGSIAEMQTGEGKTLTSAFPIAAYARQRRGVHMATVNAYLAERDFEFLEPALRLLGISSGISKPGDDHQEKCRAYACDVTFATGYELGFDFLRDQVARRSRTDQRLGAQLKQKLFADSRHSNKIAQRGFAAAIIDEIDSVLIDEATTPLVLSAGSVGGKVDPQPYRAAQWIAAQMQPDQHYELDLADSSLSLLNQGIELAHGQQRDAFAAVGRRNDQDPKLVRPWRTYVESALRAEHVMIRDINYVVRNDVVEIVDEYTGRIFSDRNWRDGLHQAVETKEDVAVTEERSTIAKVSRQRYFQRYDSLCGMTGTARGHESEFNACYQMPVAIISRRKPLIRKDLRTRYFANQTDKCAAIVNDVQQRRATGQPVLIGTRTIEQSRRVAARLNEQSVPCQVLNGLQDADESSLIATAGNSRVVTVATNMAGRGTDIQPDARSLSAGGLHVIGYERNTSLRIDRQLLGRAGRQGDPGSGQFYLAADDSLLTRHGQDLSRRLAQISNAVGVTSSDFDRRVTKIQQSIELNTYQLRKNVMREELWLDKVKKAAG